ncbi:glycoside hydrolase family 13 protein [Clostridium brassicae]|uniref:Glycoside hydrolase family 13 protein n=1 Tax=Clostridium brassicae TaxID=2999072 RepID=A0ABT4D870_9CLOT|nr:glycoside hydrolase family 13 protein [Clostridium brassicae]MCY6958500.1 glycoside hydrolase family 13 protein [Clostridium brassicae]
MHKKITRAAVHHMPKSNYSYGYDNETLHIRVKTKKGEVKRASIRIGDPYIWDAGGCDGGNMNAKGGVWIGGKTYPMRKELETEYFDHWIVEYKPDKKRARYAFILEGEEETILFTEKKVYELDGKEDEKKFCKIEDFYCFPYLNSADVAKPPKWVKDTVWYQIFPDRFCNGDHSIDPVNVEPWGTEPTGDNFMGGDLQGVINKLDYLSDLGITGLYFCPIFNATSNHRYDTIDYLQIDPRLGDKEVFKKLVKEAHSRGMKIMLDAVFNHLGYFSPQWQDVVKNGINSKYKDWFYINKYPVIDRPLDKLDSDNLNYETFGRTPKMPKLNTENPEVIEHLLKVGRYWVGEMDIDGWRLDVCNEVDHVFWRKFREEVKKIKPEVYIIGEVWHDGLPWLMGDQLDAVMNYPLTEALESFFCTNEIDAEEFKYMVNSIAVSYPMQVNESNFNLLDSHDTPRILTTAKQIKEKVKLAFLFMFTQAGCPCVYYGDEIGMEGNQGMGMEFHRRCMIWDEEKQDKDMFNFIKKLIKLKKDNDEFKLLKNIWVMAESNNNSLIYLKGDIAIIINNNDYEAVMDIPNDFKNREVLDLYNSKKIILREQVKLKPYEFKIIK